MFATGIQIRHPSTGDLLGWWDVDVDRWTVEVVRQSSEWAASATRPDYKLTPNTTSYYRLRVCTGRAGVRSITPPLESIKDFYDDPRFTPVRGPCITVCRETGRRGIVWARR